MFSPPPPLLPSPLPDSATCPSLCLALSLSWHVFGTSARGLARAVGTVGQASTIKESRAFCFVAATFLCAIPHRRHTHTHTTNLMRLSDRRCSLLPTTGYSQRNLAAQSSEWSSELSSNVSSSVIHHLPAHGRNSVGQMWYEYQHHLCQTPQSVADAPANSLWPTRSN
jgi:hypothetical protein